MLPMRKWTINGDFLTLSPNGVARYAREVTTAIEDLLAAGGPLADGLEVTLATPVERHDLPLRHIRTVHIPEFRRPRLPQAWVQLQLPRHVEGGLLSFCNLAPVAVSRQIVCMHDAHTWLMPESYGRMFRLAHRVIMPVVGRRARAVATVSQHARRQLAALGVAPEDRIAVAWNGCDHALRWRASRSPRDYRNRRPFVLCIGRNQPYKNMDLIWSIAPALAARGIEVLVAGEAGGAEALRHGPNIVALGRISDDELAAAMEAALCFVFPTRIEGFGLPAVEAMARGCPVIASTADALMEVCGDAAIHVDPDHPDGWTTAIIRLLENPFERLAMVAAGRARARLFTWRGVAETWLGLMAAVDGVPVGTLRDAGAAATAAVMVRA
ncbi:glycosyl transferase [Camelimonas fluminis]|uniref:Glycosyltransferase family 4 protein n=1 Tax=Camelimonas fluminis TaxID=1576911 RepID=A0ABV7UNR6_9HYPH|nr:glycosyltransferase family 1 protein [Camelimonas fluminis]GHE76225.1 glycosyl transferase [Camelimonas fluminis]